jgi:hypothetical protein
MWVMDPMGANYDGNFSNFPLMPLINKKKKRNLQQWEVSSSSQADHHPIVTKTLLKGAIPCS